ncbi:hypothetical protein CR513_15520, partial [Mucuna pruriens]
MGVNGFYTTVLDGLLSIDISSRENPQPLATGCQFTLAIRTYILWGPRNDPPSTNYTHTPEQGFSRPPYLEKHRLRKHIRQDHSSYSSRFILRNEIPLSKMEKADIIIWDEIPYSASCLIPLRVYSKFLILLSKKLKKAHHIPIGDLFDT